ncbi:hypothetical protein HELRODRAFT_160315 [Helobdella robusta]|uniref:BED-type domain-containing protein n=1 Tax=Helobdella robusta TaxID=6412 RepID=T1EQ29_HELRO|nr:hypothetical protein HELRODRAFT_160315 [Helobdella robusta]ESO06163.1 hypothetical protein HELRODRAFT_160315 [Helobdella robusta]
MGRNRENASREFFKYNKTDNKSTCNICKAVIKRDHAANLERHLKRNHNEEFESVQQRKKLKYIVITVLPNALDSSVFWNVLVTGAFLSMLESDHLEESRNDACEEYISARRRKISDIRD